MNLFTRPAPRLALVLGAFVAIAGCGSDDSSDLPNRPPTIGGVPNVMVDAGAAYSFTPRASDPDGDTLTFRAENLPGWATLNTSTGAITGTPGDADVGMTGMIVLEVSDNQAAAQLEPFQIQVRPRTSGTTPPPPSTVNRAPTISGTPQTTVVAGNAYSFRPSASDPDGDRLTYSIEGLPAWATFNTSTGQLSGTPAMGNVGTYEGIVIRVSDGSLSAALPSFSLQVAAAPVSNRPPVISGTPPASVAAGSTYSFAPTASDPDGNTLTFSIQNRPSWASFDPATGRLSGTPSDAQLGTFANIAISVSDGVAAVALAPFSITVTQGATNRPPVISGTPPTSVNVGQAYSFTPTASDPDGNTLTFSITNPPAWATFNTATGRLSGTPTAAHVGTTSGITITANDGRASVSLAAFAIAVVANANGAVTLSWTAPTTNTDDTPLTNLGGYRIEYGLDERQLDQVATVNNPGVTTYRVENLAAGTWYFVVRAVTTAGVESSNSNVASRTLN